MFVAGESKFADFTRGHAEMVPLPARKPKVAFAPAPVAEAEEEEEELVAVKGVLGIGEEAEAVVDVKEAGSQGALWGHSLPWRQGEGVPRPVHAHP